MIDEVKDEIETALRDSRGVVFHQKRLAFCLYFGIADILESYLKKKEVLKSGAKIDHRMFKKKKDNAKKSLENKVISLEGLGKLDKILDIAYKIESKRNGLAYGSPVSENILRSLINEFLELKKEVEND
jgi:hypothetical protein